MAAAVDLADRSQEAHERPADVVAHAADGRGGPEVLVREVRGAHSREDHLAASAVVRHEKGVCDALGLPRDPRAPLRRGDRARVDRADGGREQLVALQEERPLLGIEEREALVGADLRHVGLDLGKVRVHRQVQGGGRAWSPLGVHAERAVEGLPLEGQPEDVAGRRGALGGAGVRRHRHVAPRGQALQADEGVLATDEAGPSAGQASAEQLVSVLPGIVPVEHDPPGLRIALRIAQRREGNADLEGPAVRRDAGCRAPEEIGGRILVPAAGVVVDRVVLDASRVGEQQDARLPVVTGIEDDPPVVGVVRHVVAVRERRPDAPGFRVVELEARVERLVVVGQVADAAHPGRDVVARD